jgi:hypothetical protein
MGNYAVVNTSKLQATKSGNIENIVAPVDFQNGFVFHLGSLANGYTDVYNAVQPTTASITTQELLIHVSPEVTYLAGQNATDFYLPAGQVGRAYHLHKGDELVIANSVLDGVTGTSADTGKYLIPQNGSWHLTIANDLSGNTVFAAQIVGQTTLVQGTVPATRIKVVKA